MKSHFQVLDGLRGTAALSVLVFHISELLVPSLDKNVMPYAFLAVDFFFALSGFVIGHAYDDALAAPGGTPGHLSRGGFFARRLIRLHPMVIVAMVIGILGYLLDPYVGNAQRVGERISLGMLLLTFALSLLLLPAPTLRALEVVHEAGHAAAGGSGRGDGRGPAAAVPRAVALVRPPGSRPAGQGLAEA